MYDVGKYSSKCAGGDRAGWQAHAGAVLQQGGGPAGRAGRCSRRIRSHSCCTRSWYVLPDQERQRLIAHHFSICALSPGKFGLTMSSLKSHLTAVFFFFLLDAMTLQHLLVPQNPALFCTQGHSAATGALLLCNRNIVLDHCHRPPPVLPCLCP